MGFIYDRENRTWTFIGSQELYDEFQKAAVEYFEYMKNKNKKYGKNRTDTKSDSGKSKSDD